MENQNMLEKGSFSKLFMNMCVPTIVIMLVMVVYNMTDTYFIGKTNDPYKIAAISLCAPVFSILSGLGTLLGSGGCTIISILLGQKNMNKIKNVTSFCFYGAILLGIFFSILLLLNLDWIAVQIGANTDTLTYVKDYLKIVACFAPILLFTNIFMNLIRADGAAKQSLISNMLGTLVNVILDPILILVFHLDVAGAAIATVIGNLVSAMYILYYVLKKQKCFSLSFKDFTLKKETVFPVLTLGLPLACSTILMACFTMFMNQILMSYGTLVVAANGVSSKANMLISMILMGICTGLQPAISFNYGANNLKRMHEIIKKIGILVVEIGCVLTIGCLIFQEKFVYLFIQNEEVVSLAQKMLVASILSGPIYGLYQLETTYLQSTQKAFSSTVLSLLNKGLVYVPVMILLNLNFGLFGIFYTVPITDTISFLIGILLCVKKDKNH